MRFPFLSNDRILYSFGYVEILTIFFSTLLGAAARDASAPAAVASPSGAIIPEKVIQHNHNAQGRFGRTGIVPSDNKRFAIC